MLLPRWLPMLLMWRSLPAVIDDDRTRDGWFELNCGYLWSKLRCELSMLLLLLPWRYVGRLRTCPLLILFPLLQLQHSVSPRSPNHGYAWSSMVHGPHPHPQSTPHAHAPRTEQGLFWREERFACTAPSKGFMTARRIE